MSLYQIDYKAGTKQVTVQLASKGLPAGYTKIGEFNHHDGSDKLGTDLNHVIWHHVRDALYLQGQLDMQIVEITFTDEVKSQSVTVAPPAPSIAVNATVQLVPTVLPANTDNKSVTYLSADQTVATVSASGLVTGKKIGSTVITVRTVNGQTATSTVTVTA